MVSFLFFCWKSWNIWWIRGFTSRFSLSLTMFLCIQTLMSFLRKGWRWCFCSQHYLPHTVSRPGCDLHLQGALYPQVHIVNCADHGWWTTNAHDTLLDASVWGRGASWGVWCHPHGWGSWRAKSANEEEDEEVPGEPKSITIEKLADVVRQVKN